MTDEGDRWTVKLDVRDLGGLRGFGWSLPGLSSPPSFLFFFHGRLRVIRSMFILGALHGIEVSFLADKSLRELRTAIFKVVWSSRQPLANVGAVLSLLDGPPGL